MIKPMMRTQDKGRDGSHSQAGKLAWSKPELRKAAIAVQTQQTAGQFSDGLATSSQQLPPA